MPARNYQSIGDVLVSLKTEFPDITISKIRFLESEGLIAPERTSSGYRKFVESDVDRLRSILRLQRDEYLPLKVIRERLDAEPEAEPQGAFAEYLTTEDPDGGGESHTPASTPEPAPDIAPVIEDLPLPVAGLRMTADEMSRAAGVLPEEVSDLVTYGILCVHTDGGEEYFDGDDYQLLTIAKEFLTHGIDARHLQMYQRFADREAELLGGMVTPLVRQKNPEARQKADDVTLDLSRAATKMRQALLRIKLQRYLAP